MFAGRFAHQIFELDPEIWYGHSKGVFCRVRVRSVGYEILYRTYRIIGYRYENLTETTERSGTGMRILQKLQKLVGYGTEHL